MLVAEKLRNIERACNACYGPNARVMFLQRAYNGPNARAMFLQGACNSYNSPNARAMFLRKALNACYNPNIRATVAYKTPNACYNPNACANLAYRPVITLTLVQLLHLEYLTPIAALINLILYNKNCVTYIIPLILYR